MLEVRRKVVHILSGLTVIWLLRLGLSPVWLFALLCVGIPLSFYSKRHRVPGIAWLLDKFDRPGSDPPGKGALTYLIGVLIVVMLFRRQQDIVYSSIMILALGDAISSLVGRGIKDSGYKATKHPLSADKVLEGTFFGFLAAVMGALLFVPLLEAVVASLIGMIVEGIELRYLDRTVDDNLLVPLAAAVAIYALRFITWPFGGR